MEQPKIKIKQSENDVKKAIRQYLELHGYTGHRINNGAVWNEKKQCYIFHGTAGVADEYYTKDGDYPIWLEAKATGKKPSKPQVEFGERVNKSFGSYWFWADSLDMFISKYKSWGLPRGVVK